MASREGHGMDLLGELRIDAQLRPARTITWARAQHGDHPSRLLHWPWRHNPYPTYARLRAQGPVVRGPSGSATATTRSAVSEVLRSADFGVQAPSGAGLPEQFDVERAGAGEHLSFSSGAHYCLGAPLARLEGEVALRMLAERAPGLVPAAVPRQRRTLTVKVGAR